MKECPGCGKPFMHYMAFCSDCRQVEAGVQQMLNGPKPSDKPYVDMVKRIKQAMESIRGV